VSSSGDQNQTGPMLAVAHAFDIEAVKERLSASGGYEVVHSSPGLELGVYALVAPEPDRQQPHEDDEIYVVLEGRGVLTVEGEDFPLTEGDAIFVPAGALHQFTAYEELSACASPTCCSSRAAGSCWLPSRI
jgi:mannose-6-phosphate isomerase-like protein (cupin superfamily)